MSWVKGRIVFEDTPLRQVLRELAHWYEADLVLADSGLDSLRFTATFGQEPLDVVVQAITRTLDRGITAYRFSRRVFPPPEGCSMTRVLAQALIVGALALSHGPPAGAQLTA